MKYTLTTIVITIGLFLGSSVSVNAQEQSTTVVTPTVTPSITINCPEGQVDCYTLLEPIGSLESVDVSADPEDAQGIGGFINFMFEIGIGVAGVLGVVMLVIYGFQYAANDKNIATFDTLKTKITNVILGLLLLLGTFIILRTINPDLLIVDPEIATQYLDLEIGDGYDPGDSISDDQVPSGSTVSKSCPTGVVNVYNIVVCKAISENFKNMIDDAKKAGIVLGGGGYRTIQRQIELRNKNCSCGGNQECINNKRSSMCTPPTARPGASRHQTGLAIDMTCEGKTIKSRTNKCFTWLKNNAAKYGLYNLPSEPWHWSVDGK